MGPLSISECNPATNRMRKHTDCYLFTQIEQRRAEKEKSTTKQTTPEHTIKQSQHRQKNKHHSPAQVHMSEQSISNVLTRLVRGNDMRIKWSRGLCRKSPERRRPVESKAHMRMQQTVDGGLPTKSFWAHCRRKCKGEQERKNIKTHAQVYCRTPDKTTHHTICPLIMDGKKTRQIHNHHKMKLAGGRC
ncbi:hypothetical protein BDV25DRAFT_167440 [Aspergillus avenaceus]|uniref:Uncharacterized protein n=1 Tax=Aspergillus avenaceus TaxID=36643 RepID=A0A5N6TD40_ASPAV|nr:hypothetical protein BDV25DRAFT_167440 [Aspergillus avenaceus]